MEKSERYNTSQTHTSRGCIKVVVFEYAVQNEARNSVVIGFVIDNDEAMSFIRPRNQPANADKIKVPPQEALCSSCNGH